MKSYTSAGRTSGIVHEFIQLAKGTLRASAGIAEGVKEGLKELREVEALITRQSGLKLENLDILEIGVGQLPRQIAYFALRNRAVGIDLDVVPQGFNIPAYANLLRTNGPVRLIKTVARKLLGFDNIFRREMARQLGVPSLPSPPILQRDATRTGFPDASFDVVYSFNVFEHLPDPEAVVREAIRLLRPGGCLLTHLHLYTSDSGCHDVSILSGNRGDMPYWPHLRPAHAHLVRNAAYINKYRLHQWHDLFDHATPGCAHVHWPEKDADQRGPRIQELRATGELADFSDDELLTVNYLSIWKKP